MVQTDEDRAKADLLAGLAAEFCKLFEQAKASGAVPEGTTPVELGRCVLIIAAEEFGPISPHGKRLLANLRHFI